MAGINLESEKIMRMVTLVKLGTPSQERTEITVPFNGVEFEFLDPIWRGLARQAACLPEGRLRKDDMVATVTLAALTTAGAAA